MKRYAYDSELAYRLRPEYEETVRFLRREYNRLRNRTPNRIVPKEDDGPIRDFAAYVVVKKYFDECAALLEGHMDELLTIKEVCAILRVSQNSAYRYIAEGYLPAFKVGPKLVRIERAGTREALTPIQPKRTRPEVK